MNSTCPRGIDDAVVRDVAGEVFLVPIRRQLADMHELFVLNPVGRWVWQHLDGTRDAEQLARGVCVRFEVDEEQARTDVEAFLAELDEAHLLAQTDASPLRQGMRG